ncbi:MAG: SUMF1/EgtB/PvdO family nonheme iron enzyme [Candidatus Methylumidiphilus sp.]
MRKLSLLLAVCLAAGCAGHAENAHAEAASPAVAGGRGLSRVAGAEKRVALVIGNQDYPGRPLKNPVNDARDMKTALESLGFNVVYMENARLGEMDQAMQRFAAALDDNSVGLFYFAGHGMEWGGNNYLLPAKTPIPGKAELPERAYSANIVLRHMVDERHARLSVVILDACRTLPIRGDTGLAGMGAEAGSIVAFATAAGKPAEDGQGDNGTYTKHLLENMQKPGLTVVDALRQTQNDVSLETRDTQQPWLSLGPLKQEFCFAGCVKPFDPAAQERLREEAQRREAAEARLQDTEAKLQAAEARNRELLAQGAIKTETVLKPEKVSATTESVLKTDSVAKPQTAFGIEMVRLAGGTFEMGCGPKDGECHKNEYPRHTVTLRGFAMGKTEITQGQWKAVMGFAPPELEFTNCGDDCPVERVSWNDAQAFIKKLNEKTQGGYRLPSEAEWEYACRAGRETLYCGGDDVEQVAWYSGNASSTTHPVGQKQRNAWGLYDMSGNVWEWVQDCWHDNYQGAPGDGSVWDSSTNCASGRRAVRGGSWSDRPQSVRPAYRFRLNPTFWSYFLGFRLAQD